MARPVEAGTKVLWRTGYVFLLLFLRGKSGNSLAARWLLVGSSVRGKFSIVRRYLVCKFELERELSGWRYEEGAVERTACSVAWPLLSDIFYLHRVHEFAKGQAVSGFLCHVC